MNYIIKLTNRCNLDCIYCHEKKRMRKSKLILTESKMRNILETIEAYQKKAKDKNVRLQFTGGEALMVPYSMWKRYLGLVKEIFPKPYGVRLAMQTNLFHLTGKMIDLIKEYDIGVGASYDFNDYTRVDLKGRSSSKRVFKNMQRLRDADIDFGLICVVSNYNIDDMEKIYDYMISNGISFHFLPLNRAAYEYQKKLIIDPKHYANNLCSVIEKYVLDSKTDVEFTNGKSYSSIILKNARHDIQCTYGKSCGQNFIAIKGDGDAFTCPNCEFDEYCLGNIFDDGLEYIFDPSNPVQKKFRKRFSEATKRNTSCAKCKWRKICNQGCPHESLQQGNFYRKSNFTCEVNRIIFPKLSKLYRSLGYETKVA